MDLYWLILATLAEDKAGALVQRLKARDPQAFADLYDLYGRILYVLVWRIVRDPSMAEDIVQECFLRVWNRAGQLSDEYGSVGPWMIAIARNCALDYRKSSQSQMSAQVPMRDLDFPPISIESDLLAADRARILKNAFFALTPEQRQVLELAYYEGLSQTAIAEKLQQPLGTIKSRTRLALQKLRAELAQAMMSIPPGSPHLAPRVME